MLFIKIYLKRRDTLPITSICSHLDNNHIKFYASPHKWLDNMPLRYFIGYILPGLRIVAQTKIGSFV
jgi:hypothetical protein